MWRARSFPGRGPACSLIWTVQYWTIELEQDIMCIYIYMYIYIRFWLRRVLDSFKDPLSVAIHLSGYGVYTRGFLLGTFVTCSVTIPGLDVASPCAAHFLPVFLYAIGLAWVWRPSHRVFWSWKCMRFFLGGFLVILSVVGYGNSNSAQKLQEEKGYRSSCVVPSFQGICTPTASSSWASLESFETPSFQGSSVPSPDSPSNGECRADWVVLCHMQKNEIPAGLFLRSMWASMGTMYGATRCTSSATEVSLWSSYGMARTATAATYQEPKNSEQTAIPKEATRSLLVVQRPTIPYPCRSWKQFLGILRSVDESYTTDGHERDGERLATVSYANGITASTATAIVDGGTSSSWSTMDASSYSRSPCNAIYASAAGFYDHDDGSTVFSSRPTWDSSCGFAKTGEQCTTKAGPYCEGLQERRPSFSGVSRPDSCRDEEGRQGEHQRPLSCSQRTWQGERDIVGSGKCTPPIMVPMACIPAAISDQVEGVHGAVPGVRDGLSVTDARGHGQSPSYATTCGHCQEESSSSWHRREHSGAVGGRDGRDRNQGRGRNAKGRKRTENCGRVESGGQQPLGTLGVSRPTRAKTEETTKRPSGYRNRSRA